MDRYRLITLARLYITLLLVFVTQKVIFMLFNMGLAGGAPFGQCLLALWYGLRLDSVTAVYLLLLPALVLLVSSFFHNFPLRKVLRPYYIIVALLLSVIFVVDTVLYSFWGAKFDANDLMYAANPKDMLASLPWWAVLLGVVVIVGVAWHYCRRLLHATPVLTVNLHHFWSTLLALPLAALLFLGIRDGTSESTANPSYAYFSSYPFCNHAALNPTFNMVHSLFKAQDIGTEFQSLQQDEVDALLDGLFDPDNTVADTLLAVQRPSILLVVWESGGSSMVDNDSVGPCLRAIADSGIVFTNCYADNFRTDRGLVSVLDGWMGLPTASLMKRTDLCRNLPSLAMSLRDEGYATRFAYGGDIGFTNMRLYFLETGFDSVFGDDHYPAAWHTSAWGVPDHYMLTVANLVPRERPFFSAVLTLSSHEPWDVPMQRLADQRCNAFAYTDSCLGALVDSLRALPLWDSLLVVIVPDHGVAGNGVSSVSSPQAAHIPLVWTGGAVARPSHIDNFMMQSDLAATLLAQLGVDASAFVFSRNVFSPSFAARRPFALHCYKNGCNLITPDGVSTYDCVDRRLLSTTDSTRPADSLQSFVEALLQQVYQTSAAMATHSLSR